MPYCFFLEGSATLPFWTLQTTQASSSPFPTQTLTRAFQHFLSHCSGEIHYFPSHFQSHPSTRSAPILELLGRSLPLPHVAARLSYGPHHKHIPCSSMKKVSAPKNKMPVVFSPALKNLLSCLDLKYATREFPPNRVSAPTWVLFVCCCCCYFLPKKYLFSCFYLFSYCSHIWFISSNILIFGPLTPKRSIVKWANSSTLHNSAVHRTSTFMSLKQFLRETCIALKLAPSCFLYVLCCCFTFFFFKDFPE